MGVFAVIGSNFGDEGKGLVTDWLCRGGGLNLRPGVPRAFRRVLNVRYCGGAQAGHTVVTSAGRHVFHHYGSGTLAGAETFWSRFCPANPVKFVEETADLAAGLVDCNGRVTMDPECPVTTPYDMLLNQEAEAARGARRHGSCGLGVNETLTREAAGFSLKVRDRWDLDVLPKLAAIRDEWVPRRAADLGFTFPARWLHSMDLHRRFVADLRAMQSAVRVQSWATLRLGGYDDVVFEGAQGLRLDERAPGFPHVTRGRTGLPHVAALVEEQRAALGPLTQLTPVYVTRWYLTRHGAGPLQGECPREALGARVGCATNVANDWQGQLRYAPLDWTDWSSVVMADYYGSGEVGRPWAVVTCADQADGGGSLGPGSAALVGAERLYWTSGPKAGDVVLAFAHAPPAARV